MFSIALEAAPFIVHQRRGTCTGTRACQCFDVRSFCLHSPAIAITQQLSGRVYSDIARVSRRRDRCPGTCEVSAVQRHTPELQIVQSGRNRLVIERRAVPTWPKGRRALALSIAAAPYSEFGTYQSTSQEACFAAPAYAQDASNTSTVVTKGSVLDSRLQPMNQP